MLRNSSARTKSARVVFGIIVVGRTVTSTLALKNYNVGMITGKKVFPIALALLFAGALSAQTSTTAGEFTAEPPTLVSLGFEWRITGDDNRNATVETSYRKKGESDWRPALPLMRLQREEIGTAPGPRRRERGAIPVVPVYRCQHVRRQHSQS